MRGPVAGSVRRPSRRLGGAALVLLAGCSFGGPEMPLPASALDGLQGRQCRWASDPETTPSFRDLTRAGTAANIALLTREMEAADTVVFSVRYGYDGALLWVESIQGSMPVEEAEPLEIAIMEGLNLHASPDWGVRLTLVGGAVERVEPSVLCDPEQVNGNSVWYGIPGAQEALADFVQRRGRRYPVRVTLDEQGRIMEVELVRSSYSRWVDQYIKDFMWASTFAPRLHDRIGVATTFEFDFVIPRR